MILSNITPRAIIKGTVFRGGGGGVTSYTQLNDKPQINGVTIEDNYDGNYYGLANSSDVPTIGANLTPSALNRLNTLTLNGNVYQVSYNNFEEDANGLVPAPSAADANKVLFGDGTWKGIIPNIDYSTLEANTGIKWINNKDIYQKTLVLKTGGADQYTYTNNEYIDCLPHGIDYINIINMYCNRTGSDYIDCLPNSNEVIIVPNISTHNIYLFSNHNPTEVIVTIQYTKA